MNTRRILLGVAGVGMLVLAQIARGDAVHSLRDTIVSTLGNDYLFIAAFGSVAFLLAILVFVAGRSTNLVQKQMPHPEEPLVVPTAGDDFDEMIHSWRFRLPIVGRPVGERVRARLRATAVETLVATRGGGQSDAESLIDRGAWTTNPEAAQFLADGVSPSLAVRTRSWLNGEVTRERCARQTASEIASEATARGRPDD